MLASCTRSYANQAHTMKGPESKDIDPWENPEFDVKDPGEVTEQEQATRRRIAREVKRVNKWLMMEKSWSKNRLPQKLQERTWKGIPEKLRMKSEEKYSVVQFFKVWPRLLGANSMRDPNVYQELLIRARLVSKDIKQIDLDINRTYRDHLAFRRRYDVKQQSLMNVLAAYSMYNTEVGYCQGETRTMPKIEFIGTGKLHICPVQKLSNGSRSGSCWRRSVTLVLRFPKHLQALRASASTASLNTSALLSLTSSFIASLQYFKRMSQIAALFLMYLDEEETFWCIHALMVGRKYTMHGFFVPGFPKLARFETHFKKILKKYRPLVYKHLEKNDIPYIYLTKWWFGCFLDRVPFSLALRLWDVYILEGDCVLLAMALNIMKMHEKTIRTTRIENFMDFIQTTLPSNFGYSDDETMFSLREVLNKLKSDGLHIPPPPQPDDLAEVPIKALGPILARKISSIRDEQLEIKSRRSHTASVGRSPHPHRSAVSKHSRIPSVSGSRFSTSGDARSSSNFHETHQIVPSAALKLNEIPSIYRTNRLKQHYHTSPPGYVETSTDSGYLYPMRPSGKSRTSWIRDERTGRMVTVVRSDEDDFDGCGTSRKQRELDERSIGQQRITDSVHHMSNNVTVITLNDDSVI
ncbi:TBC domain protein [Dictyocaulus viviparus]|uniref:TBC domain protein n=1 Tax=Dictyocaulus viviparus TaxID=29172 RepID=A0A0D8XQ24_DICVI|nr:TBC domain protein [Dictyocaulus viviparus]